MGLNFKLQTNTKILDPKVMYQQAEEAVMYLDAKMATELQPQMEEVIANKVLAPSTLQEWKVMLAKIKFVRFTSISISEMRELVINYLPVCYTIPEFDLKDRIGKRLIFIGEIEQQINFMDELSQAFSACKMMFGSAKLELEGKQLDPTIGNWIRLYLGQPAKSALRTNIDEWTFVEQGNAGKFLSKPQREILLDILRIYDSLRNRVYSYRSLPESDDENEIFKNYDSYASLPGLTINEEDPMWQSKYGDVLVPSIEKFELPPGLEQAEDRQVIEKQPQFHIESARPKIQQESPLIFPTVEKRTFPPIVPLAKPSTKQINIQDILSSHEAEEDGDRGLKTPNVVAESKPAMQVQKNDTQTEIDKKLEELKKKTQKNI